jgi:DNA polymerase-3 subunit alpha
MLDGAARSQAAHRRGGQQGMPAIAVTDHGNTFGAFEFYKTATGSGIKPIIGMEAYVTPGTHRADKARVRWGQPRSERRRRLGLRAPTPT